MSNNSNIVFPKMIWSDYWDLAIWYYEEDEWGDHAYAEYYIFEKKTGAIMSPTLSNDLAAAKWIGENWEKMKDSYDIDIIFEKVFLDS